VRESGRLRKIGTGREGEKTQRRGGELRERARIERKERVIETEGKKGKERELV